MKFWQCLRLFKEDEYDLKESDMIGQSKVGKVYRRMINSLPDAKL